MNLTGVTHYSPWFEYILDEMKERLGSEVYNSVEKGMWMQKKFVVNLEEVLATDEVVDNDYEEDDDLNSSSGGKSSPGGRALIHAGKPTTVTEIERLRLILNEKIAKEQLKTHTARRKHLILDRSSNWVQESTIRLS